MNILIDNKSGEPIYNQIYSQIKNQIIGGDITDTGAKGVVQGFQKLPVD